MTKLKVNGRLIVDNFYKKFEALYPYLNPALFYPDDIGGGEVDTKLTIANARARSIRQDINGYTSTGELEINIGPETTLAEFKKQMEKQFLVRCYINCRLPESTSLLSRILTKENKKYKWTAVDNTKYAKMTLADANESLKNDGAQKVIDVRTKGTDLGNKYL